MTRIILLALLTATVILFLVAGPDVCNLPQNIGMDEKINPEPEPEIFPFSKGEKIIYNVNLFGLKIGQSELIFVGSTLLNNKKVELIILSTNVNNLRDVEKIYVDRESFLPLRVERSVVFFGKKMNIVEEYDHQKNLLILTKTEGRKTTKETIKSQKPIQNIISLVFLFRKSKKFDIGQTVDVSLPPINLEMKITNSVDFSTANTKYKAYLFESVPKRYRIWIDQGPKKIPLRLDGAIAFGNAAMVMRSFVSGEN